MSKRKDIVILVIVLSVIAQASPAHAAPKIEGAGASFPQLEIEQWRSDVSQKPYNLTVNYVSSGSTFGRNQYINGLVDFGVSDIAFQGPKELADAAKRPYAYVPISAGGVGFMYNLKDTAGRRIVDLKLTPDTVCRLFTEPGIMWDDAAIRADNPGVALPKKPVRPVYRSDRNGTGHVFTEFCIQTARLVWDKFIAAVDKNENVASSLRGDPFFEGKPTSTFPVLFGSSAFASDGVADAVADGIAGEGRITYVEAGFAEIRNMPNALVRNAAGVFQYPESCNVARALTHARAAGDGTLALEYLAPDKDAYFPSSYSYAIVPTAGIATDKGAVLAQFLDYAVTKGQERADSLGYAPISREIVDIAIAAIRKIPGAPAPPPIVTFTPGDCAGGVPDPGGGSGGGGSGGGAGGSDTGGGGGGAGGGSGAGAGAGGGASGGGAGGGDSAGGGGAGGGAGGSGSGGGGSATGSGSGGGGTTGSSSGGGSAGGTSTGGTSTGSTGGRVSGTGSSGGATAVGGASAARSASGSAAPVRASEADSGSLQRDVANAPSNQQVLWAVLQGAVLCAAGAALSRRFRGEPA